jgi:hypothetical protein
MRASTARNDGEFGETVLIDWNGFVETGIQVVPCRHGKLVELPCFFSMRGKGKAPVRFSIHDGLDCGEVSLAFVVLHQLDNGVLSLVDDSDIEMGALHGFFRQ